MDLKELKAKFEADQGIYWIHHLCTVLCNLQAAEQLVDLKELKAKIEAEQAESDEMAQAEQMLKLKTVKIQKAR